MRKLALLPFLFACSEPAEPPEETCAEADATHRVAVVTELRFVRSPEDGISEGFDLDGHVSTLGGTTGCGVADDVDAEGTPGIDNAFARLLPALELTEAQAVEEIIQSLINTGELLLLIEMNNIEQPECASASLVRGSGAPYLGADDVINSGQTFDRDHEVPASQATSLSIEGNEVRGDLAEVEIPFTFLDFQTTLRLEQAKLGFHITEDGDVEGMMGGGVAFAELLEIAGKANIDPAISQIIDQLVSNTADLKPDEQGLCTQLSVTMAYTAVPAFLFGAGGESLDTGIP